MAVFTKELKKHIFVHPGEQHKLHNAIKAALLRDRKRYNESLEGALLDVQNVKVLGDRYRIVEGYLSMEVIANFQVFAPSVGMTLRGVINKVSQHHYGCLVMDLFNASLSVPQTSTLVAKEGDMCAFTVSKLVVDGDLLFMRGELTSVNPTDDSDFPNVTVKQENVMEVSAAAVTSIKTEIDDLPSPAEGVSDSEHSVKKSEKRKSREGVDNDNLLAESNVTVKSPKKIKKEKVSPEKLNRRIKVESGI